MIQIIGFLICACLAIKVMEIMADARFLDENGERRPSANIAILVGTIAVPAFTLWLLAQGEALQGPDGELDRLTAQADQQEAKVRCMEAVSPDLEAMLAC